MSDCFYEVIYLTGEAAWRLHAWPPLCGIKRAPACVSAWYWPWMNVAGVLVVLLMMVRGGGEGAMGHREPYK